MDAEYLRMYDKVKALLEQHAANAHAREVKAPMVAEHSLMMNHMYEDMGFESRTQMGAFMKEHFPSLAALKPKDKLWKKYIYDMVGEIAPACMTCDDQLTCFRCILAEQSA